MGTATATEIRDMARLICVTTERAVDLPHAKYIEACKLLDQASLYLTEYLAYNNPSAWAKMDVFVEQARTIVAKNYVFG